MRTNETDIIMNEKHIFPTVAIRAFPCYQNANEERWGRIPQDTFSRQFSWRFDGLSTMLYY